VLSPKVGMSLGDTDNGWKHYSLTITPDVPGDSGSPYLDSRGRALGQLSTLGVAVGLPPLANGVGDLRRELAYLNDHPPAGITSPVQLAVGTEPFNPNQLPLGL
jgi:hypothetical protein